MNIVKILIADSNVVNRTKLIRLLKKLTENDNCYLLFDEACSGDECIKSIAKKGNPNLLILEDFFYEKENGPNIVAKLRMKRSTRYLPIIAIGNGARLKQEFEAVEVNGFINFLTFKPESLWIMVKDAIQN
ncbi:MAG: hypothetical protein PHZ07_01255 [Patescibacteria group bacterium]|nr:hypothetical protein [Patescibacteria group bacterium]MDD4303936.1 hypothetical protein [Patescibacteria group bacterium]MDD4695076.1 hypothetical protein [Patescibacteria group bacterium]